MRDNLLVTMGARAAYMECKGLIELPAGVDGEAKLAKFVASKVDNYIDNNIDESFDCYIEEALMKEYSVKTERKVGKNIMSKWTPNEYEEKLIKIIEEAKEYCNGELELDNFDGEWYALDYRADLEGALSIDNEKYNTPVITDEDAKEYNVDVIKCLDYCDVLYVE